MSIAPPPDEEIRAAIETVIPRRFRIVRTRRRVTRSSLPASAEASADLQLGAALQDLWDAEASAAKLLAQRTRTLAELHAEPGEDDHGGECLQLELNADRAALAMQVTRNVALQRIRDARMAVDTLPRCLELLAQGRMPADRFTRLVRTTRVLRDPHRRLVDQLVVDWGDGLTAEAFERRLRQLVAWMLDRIRRRKELVEEPRRGIEVLPPASDGTACLQVFGPAPEILELGRRLDAAARAVQDAQRRALAEGAPVPLDVDGLTGRRGRPLPLNLLSYHLLRTAELDTQQVRVPQPRFRMSITVPAMTLLGVSDAPGTIDGIHPIPADMARELAGSCEIWHRVLTEPSTGAYLPLAADTYRPSAALLEHLRQRGPTCAVPGCTRSVCTASENDHIREYDHAHPELGGRTSSENCHLLCWMHHRMKTEGMIDPVRLGHLLAPRSGGDPGNLDPRGGDPGGDVSRSADPRSVDPGGVDPRSGPPPGATGPTGELGPGRTRWRIGPEGERVTVLDDVDIMTPAVVSEIEELWEAHLEREELRRHPPQPVEDPPPY